MTSPVQRSNSPQEYEDVNVCCCIYWRKAKKLSQPSNAPTKAFKKEFSPLKKEGLAASPPIRMNSETGNMEVAYNDGAGIRWRPLSTDKEG